MPIPSPPESKIFNLVWITELRTHFGFKMFYLCQANARLKFNGVNMRIPLKHFACVTTNIL